MRSILKHTLTASAALALTLVTVPTALNGQEAERQAECTAQLSPAQIQAGQRAVQVTVALSAPVGSSVELVALEETGLRLATPGDLPRSEMAAEGETPRPIQLSAEGGSELKIWLNTQNARPGSHEVTFEGSENACTGEITIAGGSSG